MVEDNSLLAISLQAVFKQKGWEVVIAATVEEAFRHLAGAFDWVILDLMLPDGDGGDVLKEIRARNLPMRVAVTTGVNEPAQLAALDRFRPEAVLQKPAGAEDLFRVMGIGS